MAKMYPMPILFCMLGVYSLSRGKMTKLRTGTTRSMGPMLNDQEKVSKKEHEFTELLVITNWFPCIFLTCEGMMFTICKQTVTQILRHIIKGHQRLYITIQ